MHSVKLFGEGECRVEWEGMKSWASGECVFSQVGEHAGSRPKQFMLSSPTAGVVIVIDWVCCSRHFVFFQLSIGCPWNLFFFTLCFNSNTHKHGRWGRCVPSSVCQCCRGWACAGTARGWDSAGVCERHQQYADLLSVGLKS